MQEQTHMEPPPHPEVPKGLEDCFRRFELTGWAYWIDTTYPEHGSEKVYWPLASIWSYYPEKAVEAREKAVRAWREEFEKHERESPCYWEDMAAMSYGIRCLRLSALWAAWGPTDGRPSRKKAVREITSSKDRDVGGAHYRPNFIDFVDGWIAAKVDDPVESCPRANERGEAWIRGWYAQRTK
jgi:hypothetical protein